MLKDQSKKDLIRLQKKKKTSKKPFCAVDSVVLTNCSSMAKTTKKRASNGDYGVRLIISL